LDHPTYKVIPDSHYHADKNVGLLSRKADMQSEIADYQQTGTNISKRMKDVDLPLYFNSINQEVEGEDYKR
jgi:hypothetical protein